MWNLRNWVAATKLNILIATFDILNLDNFWDIRLLRYRDKTIRVRGKDSIPLHKKCCVDIILFWIFTTTGVCTATVIVFIMFITSALTLIKSRKCIQEYTVINSALTLIKSRKYKQEYTDINSALTFIKSRKYNQELHCYKLRFNFNQIKDI